MNKQQQSKSKQGAKVKDLPARTLSADQASGVKGGKKATSSSLRRVSRQRKFQDH